LLLYVSFMSYIVNEIVLNNFRTIYSDVGYIVQKLRFPLPLLILQLHLNT